MRTSNAGQCLFTGIAEPEHARRMVGVLLGRTVLRLGDSHHRLGDGSRIQSHGVSQRLRLAARQRLDRPGAGPNWHGEAAQIWTGLFEAALYFDLHRMPELFCGFPQDPGEGPVPYPVACSPQAWSAASVFLLFQACLGLEIERPQARSDSLARSLPTSCGELRIHNLEVAGAKVDLLLVRHEDDVGINVLRTEGQVCVIVEK